MLKVSSTKTLMEQLQGSFRLVETGADHSPQDDQRQHPRYALESGRVEVEVITSTKSCACGLLADVSTDSARIIADYVPQVGEVVGLSFKLDGSRLVLKGQVHHRGKEGEVRFFGVSFV